MDELDLAKEFDRPLPQLRGVAYRTLGSLTETDDAVQEHGCGCEGPTPHRSTTSRLTTVAARICLNMLRSHRTRRVQPLDGLPPGANHRRPGGRDRSRAPGFRADAVGVALQVVLGTLGRAEQLAFVLHDMFAVPFDEVRCDGRPVTRGGSPAAPAAACATGRRRRIRT